MKIGMKGGMGVADKMALPTKLGCWFWDRARAACVVARNARQNALICSL